RRAVERRQHHPPPAGGRRGGRRHHRSGRRVPRRAAVRLASGSGSRARARRRLRPCRTRRSPAGSAGPLGSPAGVPANPPPARRTVISAVFCLCIAVLIVTAFQGFAPDYPMRLFQGIAVAVGALGLLGGAIALAVTHLTDYREPEDEDEFERLVIRSEQLA